MFLVFTHFNVGVYFIWFLFVNSVLTVGFSDVKRKEHVFVSDDRTYQKNYKVEDFFWTGSGDSPVLDEVFINDTDDGQHQIQSRPWNTKTVFHTTTIMFATVYNCPEHGCNNNEVSPIFTEVINTTTSQTVPEISPTPSYTTVPPHTTQTNKTTKRPARTTTTTTTKRPSTSRPNKTTTQSTKRQPKEEQDIEWDLQESDPTIDPRSTPDQRYWLLTVLRSDSFVNINTEQLEDKLASLYRRAFIRQQEKHLGINNNTLVSRQRRDQLPEPVRVYIHNLTKSVSNDPNGLGLLYSVTVSGKPVLALTAANDMRLLTVNEVSEELGYPILTKAEPYLKGVVPVGARVKGRTRDTWLLIGSVLAAVSLLVILAALFTIGLSNKRNKRGMTNRKQLFEGEEGKSNLGFQEDADGKQVKSSSRDGRSAEGGVSVKFADDERRSSTSSSSCSGSSEASLVRLRHQQRKKEARKEQADGKPKPKPRTRFMGGRPDHDNTDGANSRKGGLSAGSGVSKDTLGGTTTEGFDDADSITGASPRTTRTPTSYLSMPSVKAFPRAAKIPEPLSRVLEPTSIKYLDNEAEVKVPSAQRFPRTNQYQLEHLKEATNKYVQAKGLTRHGSMDGEDPGVIGPLVWDKHCQKLEQIKLDSMELDESDGRNVGRMRRRFNELLDDAFSMFGSRSVSPEDKDDNYRSCDTRVHSAVVRPAGYRQKSDNRPKTSEPHQRPQTAAVGRPPKGAWDSPNCCTPNRPISAGPHVKRTDSQIVVDRSLILVDSELSPHDPAVPLIAAIKQELKKFQHPLPGGT